jgi:hypothetical protein
MSVRILNVLIGTWLFLSTFMWPHQPIHAVATLVCAVVIVLLSLGTIYVPRLRYGTALAALTLFVTSVATSGVSDRTVWHNTVVAVIVLVAALVDTRQRRLRDDTDELSKPLEAH